MHHAPLFDIDDRTCAMSEDQASKFLPLLNVLFVVYFLFLQYVFLFLLLYLFVSKFVFSICIRSGMCFPPGLPSNPLQMMRLCHAPCCRPDEMEANLKDTLLLLVVVVFAFHHLFHAALFLNNDSFFFAPFV